MTTIVIPARLTNPDPITQGNAQTVYSLIVDTILNTLTNEIAALSTPAQLKIAASMSNDDFVTFRSHKKNLVSQLGSTLESGLPTGVTLDSFEYISGAGQFEATFTIKLTTP